MLIRNLTNSPYDIVIASGERVRLPARGEIEVDVHPMHLPLYRAIGYFQITEGEGIGLERLRAEFIELTGQKPHHLWKEARLQAEIDKALAE